MRSTLESRRSGNFDMRETESHPAPLGPPGGPAGGGFVPPTMPLPLLSIDNLTISRPGPGSRETPLVDQMSLHVHPGERIGIVGESGSGKSLTAAAALGLVPPPARITKGTVTIAGIDLLAAPEQERNRIRGSLAALVPQEPATALNPVYSVGFQLREVLRLHRHLSRRDARNTSLDLLVRTGLRPPAAIARAYAHQLSGGQLQRVMIALALAGQPQLLIADEPTTALDAVTARDILRLLDELVTTASLALVLISHDLDLVASYVDTVIIMYAGEIVEHGPADEIFARPVHPYTAALLRISRQIRGGVPAHQRLTALEGTIPAPGHWAPGCRFAPRCHSARPACSDQHPDLVAHAPGRRVRCFFPLSGAPS